MNEPSVTIIIPCYNKRAYVAAAIESALGQTHPCEVVVIDDGSTDGSVDEIRRFEGRIHWETGKNRGGSAARNRGLQLAQSEWIQFLDADDMMPPEKIARQIVALKGANKDVLAFCGWSYLYNNGEIARPDVRRYWHSYGSGADLLVELWLYGGFFPPHAWLMSRALIDKAGIWDERLTADDDGEFVGRMLVAATDVRFCADTCVLYRDPPANSVSRDKSLKSARSCWTAFERASDVLLTRRSDALARRACMSRARRVAYAWRDVPEIIDQAARWEQANYRWELSPSLPRITRWLVMLFGLRLGFALRQFFWKLF